MFFTLVKKEILTNILNLRVFICYIIIFILITFSIIIKGLQYQHVLGQYRTNSARYEMDLSKKEEKGWWEYDVQIPPRQLSIFFEGYNRQMCRPFHVQINFAGSRPMGDYDHDYPLFKIYKVYDFTFVIAFILSLLAIFITYDAVTGERESGTLRLALSNQVNKGKFLLGKLTGGYLSVILPYLISFFAALLILLLATEINLSMMSYTRLGLALGGSLLYLGVIFLVTILASIYFSRSSTALFSILILWVVMAFIVPYLAAQISRKVVPTMQFKDMFLTLTKIQDEENAKARKEFEPHKKSENRAEISNGIWRRAHGRMEDRWVVFLKDYKNRFNNQMQLGIVLARVSPVASYVLAASNLFNTGLHDYRHAEEWKDELEITSKKVFDDEMNRRRKKFAHLEYRKRNEEVGKEQKFDLKLLPTRTYLGISLPVSLLLSLPDGIILLLENILLFMLCFIAFVKRGVN